MLQRTRVGPFRVEQAVAPEAVTVEGLVDEAALVADLPRRDLDDAGRVAAVHGRPVPAGQGAGERVALLAEGHLIAVAERVGDLLKPRVVVAE